MLGNMYVPSVDKWVKFCESMVNGYPQPNTNSLQNISATLHDRKSAGPMGNSGMTPINQNISTNLPSKKSGVRVEMVSPVAQSID